MMDPNIQSIYVDVLKHKDKVQHNLFFLPENTVLVYIRGYYYTLTPTNTNVTSLPRYT